MVPAGATISSSADSCSTHCVSQPGGRHGGLKDGKQWSRAECLRGDQSGAGRVFAALEQFGLGAASLNHCFAGVTQRRACSPWRSIYLGSHNHQMEMWLYFSVCLFLKVKPWESASQVFPTRQEKIPCLQREGERDVCNSSSLFPDTVTKSQMEGDERMRRIGCFRHQITML